MIRDPYHVRSSHTPSPTAAVQAVPPPATTPVAEPTSATITKAAHGAVTGVPGVDVALTPATPAACSTKCRDDLTKVQKSAGSPAITLLIADTSVITPVQTDMMASTPGYNNAQGQHMPLLAIASSFVRVPPRPPDCSGPEQEQDTPQPPWMFGMPPGCAWPLPPLSCPPNSHERADEETAGHSFRSPVLLPSKSASTPRKCMWMISCMTQCFYWPTPFNCASVPHRHSVWVGLLCSTGKHGHHLCTV